MHALSIRTPVRFVVMPMALLAALMLLGWYFIQPLSFPSLTQRNVEQVSVVVVQDLPPVTDEETSSALPQSDTKQALFSAGNPTIEVMQHTLNFTSYHRSWETLTGTRAVAGGEDYLVSITGYDAEGNLILEIGVTGGKNIFVNGRAYQTGWLGGGAGEALAENLTEVLDLA